MHDQDKVVAGAVGRLYYQAVHKRHKVFELIGAVPDLCERYIAR